MNQSQDQVSYGGPPPPYFTGGGMDYQPSQPQHLGFNVERSTPVITTQPIQHVVVANTIALGHHSQRLICPRCGVDIQTSVEHESGLLTHLIALACFCVGCWLGCCLIPYCADECKDTQHQCPNCKTNLGFVKRL